MEKTAEKLPISNVFLNFIFDNEHFTLVGERACKKIPSPPQEGDINYVLAFYKASVIKHRHGTAVSFTPLECLEETDAGVPIVNMQPGSAYFFENDLYLYDGKTETNNNPGYFAGLKRFENRLFHNLAVSNYPSPECADGLMQLFLDLTPPLDTPDKLKFALQAFGFSAFKYGLTFQRILLLDKASGKSQDGEAVRTKTETLN